MTIQDKFSTIPDNAQVSVLWSKGAAEFICDAGQIKRAMSGNKILPECSDAVFDANLRETAKVHGIARLNTIE